MLKPKNPAEKKLEGLQAVIHFRLNDKIILYVWKGAKSGSLMPAWISVSIVQ